MALSVAKRSVKTPLIVRVGTGQVLVHGTRFTVEAVGGELAAVHVAEGSVTVTTPGEPAGRRLGPGEHWGAATSMAEHQGALGWLAVPTASDAAPASELMVTSTPTGAQVTVADRVVGTTPLWLRGLVAAPTVRVELAGFEPWQQQVAAVVHGRRTVHATLTALPEPVALPTPAASRALPRRLPVFVAAERRFEKRDCAGVKRALQELLQETAVPDERSRALLLLAECYVRTSRRKEALAAYDQVVVLAPHDTTGATATFEGAKLCSELGRPADALARFERFLSTYPGSGLQEAAAFRRCELLVKLKRHPEARACLTAHRRDYPASPRARDAALMSASLACLEEDAAGLRAELQRYLAHGTAASDDDETFYQLARCLSRTPHADNRKLVERYLDHSPESRHAADLRALLERF